VSALEGGYQLLGQNSSAFAKSVKRHVTWLTHAAVDAKIYSASDSEIEKEYERKVRVSGNCSISICKIIVLFYPS
jgi:hypothetical protein